MKHIYPAVFGVLIFASSLQADITADNITATSSLSSLGTLEVDGQSTFNGEVEINNSVIIDDGSGASFVPWTTAPTGAYWNTVLEDGLFIWGDTSLSGSLGLNLAYDKVLFWYPEKFAFRAVATDNTSGDEANIGLHSFAIGNGAYASGENSIALGRSIKAYALDSISIGSWTEASGAEAIAIGIDSDATDNGSLTIGRLNIASGLRSVSMGRDSDALGDYSISLGAYTTASEDYGLAIGYWTQSHGESAIAIGFGTVAESYAMTALGMCNEIPTGQSADSWVAGDELLVIGNGVNASSLSNALTIYKNADAEFSGNFEAAGAIKLAAPAGGVPMGNYGMENP